MEPGRFLLAFFVFPGLLYALLMAWLVLWVERKLTARMQGRIGPPFYQPFFDFVKLMAKRPVPRTRLENWAFTALPLLAVGASLGALALLPVQASGTRRVGDLILLAALLEVPPICAVLAGFASRSLFGQVGAVREGVLMIASNLPFLTALVALAVSVGSLDLNAIARGAPGFVRLLVFLGLFLCLPVKLRINPFSLANADQEIYTGPTTEFGGAQLALWELAHGMEWVALTGVIASLVIPWRAGWWTLDALLFVFYSLIMVALLSALAAATARLKIFQATRLYLRWGLGMSLLALLAAALPFGG